MHRSPQVGLSLLAAALLVLSTAPAEASPSLPGKQSPGHASRKHGKKRATRTRRTATTLRGKSNAAPSAPTGLTATTGDATVSLAWNASKAVKPAKLSGYRLYRRRADGTWPTSPLGSTSAATRTFKDAGLTNGTTYAYRVTAFDTAGQESLPSGIVSATPVAPTPTPDPTPPPSPDPAPTPAPTPCGAGSAYSSMVLATAGLAGYWQLGDSSGTTACDSRGQNPGTYAGGFTLGVPGGVYGEPGTAARFDGSTGRVSVANSAGLTFGDTFSVEAWVRRGAISTSGNQVVASRQSGSWVLMFNPANRLVLRRAGDIDVSASTQAVGDTTNWHYVAATKNGSSVHLYVDGRDVTGPVTNATMTNNTMPLAIGQSSDTAYFNGTIDEVAAYTSVLAPGDVSAHYASGVAPAPPASTDPVIGTAGDIACSPANASFNGGLGSATACRQQATSDLLVGAGLSAVLPLGDNQYDSATLSEFAASYDPTWGRLKAITRPVAGNHEYDTPGAAGYFDYFDGAGAATGPAGDRSKGYYSWDLGAWHLVALNSECGQVGGCAAGSPQEQWLRADLAAHPAKCTLAYWHKPLFNAGDVGVATDMHDIYQALQEGGADLVLNGHAHSYQRFAPQTADGAADVNGIRELIVGTGGEDHQTDWGPVPNIEAQDFTTFGVARITLHPAGYDWRFVPESGGSFTDSGSTACH